MLFYQPLAEIGIMRNKTLRYETHQTRCFHLKECACECENLLQDNL